MKLFTLFLALCLLAGVCVARVWQDDDGTHLDNTEIEIDTDVRPSLALSRSYFLFLLFLS